MFKDELNREATVAKQAIVLNRKYMSEILIYKAENDQIEVSVQFEKDTVWLNRNELSELFNRDVKTIGKHINNVFKEGELERNPVVAKFATTALDGKTYQTEHYNLDVIISVGYRVKSKQGTKFRIWANRVLKDYLVKGYAINEKRLAQKEQEVKGMKGRYSNLDQKRKHSHRRKSVK